MRLDLRSLREWLMVALHRGRIDGTGLVGPDGLVPGLGSPASREVHPEG